MTLNFEIILKEISRNNLKSATFVTRVIWYRMYNFKNVKNSHGGVLLLVKFQAETCNFTKSNTPPWMFFTFIKLYKWYHIAQRIIATYRLVDVATRKLFGLQFIDLSHGDSQITGPYFLQSKSCVNGI